LGIETAHKKEQINAQKEQIAAQLIAAQMNARNNQKGNE
jgi:hypothetical protein